MSIYLCHSPSTRSKRVLLSEKGSFPLIVLDGTHLIKISELWSKGSLLDIETELEIKGLEETRVRPLFFCKLVECAILHPETEPHDLALSFCASEREWDISKATLKNEKISLRVYEVPGGYVTLEDHLCSARDGHRQRVRELFTLLMAHTRRMTERFKPARVDLGGLCVFVLAGSGGSQKITALFALRSAKTFLSLDTDEDTDDEGEPYEKDGRGKPRQGAEMELRVLRVIASILEKNSESDLNAELECDELNKLKKFLEDSPHLKPGEVESHEYFRKTPDVVLLRRR